MSAAPLLRECYSYHALQPIEAAGRNSAAEHPELNPHNLVNTKKPLLENLPRADLFTNSSGTQDH